MIDPNRMLWLHVLQQAFMDATAISQAQSRNQAAAKQGSLEQRTADRWIRDCGRDFRQVCELAGMDAEFLSGAYRAGRVNAARLRSLDRGPVSVEVRIRNRAYQARLYADSRARRAGAA